MFLPRRFLDYFSITSKNIKSSWVCVTWAVFIFKLKQFQFVFSKWEKGKHTIIWTHHAKITYVAHSIIVYNIQKLYTSLNRRKIKSDKDRVTFKIENKAGIQ